MQSKRIKGITFLATLLAIGLVVLSAYLLIKINSKQKIIDKQKAEISKLQNEINFNNNQDINNENKDDKDSDIIIEIKPGE